MSDNTELKRLATRIVEVQTSQDVPISKIFDDFEAAACPETILALIAENERLHKLVSWQGGAGNEVTISAGQLMKHMDERDQLKAENERLTGCIVQRRAQAEQYDQALIKMAAERDQLRAEVAGLRTGYEAYEQVNAELKAENQRLRSGMKGDYDLDAWLDWAQEAEELRKEADKWKIVQRAGDQLLADEGRAAIWSACSRILISVASELNSGRSVVTEEGVTSGGVEIGDWRVTVERIDAAMGQGEQS